MSTRIAYTTATGEPTRDQREAQKQTRIQFVTGRNAALGAQRDKAIERLSKVRADVRSIHTSITTSDTLSDADKILAILERHRVTEAKLIEEIDRLALKMSR